MKDSSKKPRGILKKIGLYGVLPLFAVILIAHLSFKYSGSNEWEAVGERGGVQLYSMKVSGETLKKYKGVVRVKTTLSRIVAFMQDSETDLDAAGFHEPREIKRESDQLFWTTWKQAIPEPLKYRDFVVKHEFTQNPENQEVMYQLRATPDLIPEDECCVRVPRIDNSWRLIPLDNGEVEIHWVIDMDVGGNIPYLLMNHSHPDLIYSFAARLQSYFDRPQYEGAHYDWISEKSPN